MWLTESRRHTLAFWSLGLALLAMAGSIVAWLFVDGYDIDWPMMGIMAATIASASAILIMPKRPKLRLVLNGLALALTFPLSAWILWRIFVRLA